MSKIEQSRRLLELGLDPKTADCGYFRLRDGDEWFPFIIYYKEKEIENKIDLFGEENVVVSWSFDALVNAMPKEIKKDDKQYGFHLETTHNLYYVSYYRYDIDGIRYLHTTELYDCIIDAAYEMTCWLLEQGLIKKEDKK